MRLDLSKKPATKKKSSGTWIEFYPGCTDAFQIESLKFEFIRDMDAPDRDGPYEIKATTAHECNQSHMVGAAQAA